MLSAMQYPRCRLGVLGFIGFVFRQTGTDRAGRSGILGLDVCQGEIQRACKLAPLAGSFLTFTGLRLHDSFMN